jgi:phosphate-selective porin OprO/OprP
MGVCVDLASVVSGPRRRRKKSKNRFWSAVAWCIAALAIFGGNDFARCQQIVGTSEPVLDETCCPKCADGDGRIPLFPYWDHGLRFSSEDEQFNLHLGGNVQWDSVWLLGSDDVLGAPSSNATSTTNSGASLPRRARFKADGNIYETFDYTLEFDLANAVNENKGQQAPTQDNVSGSPFPCNVWMQLRDVPFFGRVRIGNQVKAMGMTNNTYQGFLPFLERADNMDGFYGPFDEGFDPGISAIDWTESERITWRYGLFRPLKNAFGIGINRYTVGGRVTALPIFEDDGARLLHVGLGASQGSLSNDQFRIRARPVLRNGPGYAVPVLVDTTTLPGSSQFLVGPELAGVLGPLTFQAEWTGQFFSDAMAANGQDQGTVFFHGGYAQVLCFLTGEHQEYEKKEGVFARVVPHNSLRFARGSGCGGCGAWQVGFRLSYLDLIDKAIDGGQIVDMTFGLNWFLNPNMKIQGNYLLAHRDGQQGAGDGWFSGLGVRAAFDF